MSKQKTQKEKYTHYFSVTFQKILKSAIWKKTGLKGTVKVFSVDYSAIDTNDILDIHRDPYYRYP